MAILVPIDNVRLPGTVESEMVAPLAGMWSTSRIMLDGGGVQANQNWAHPLRQYEIKLGACSPDEIEAIRTMAIARRGIRAFLIRDWSDYQGVDEPLGTGDGDETDFPIIRYYADTALPYSREITRLDTPPALVAKVDGSVTAHTIIDGRTVRISPAPAIGLAVTATFNFLVPVRFADDLQTLRVIHRDLLDTDVILLEEVQDAA